MEAMQDRKYQALVETLKTNILSGKYRNGKPFPSVRALIRRHGLSNTTVLHAMDELVRLGLISREQGRGTFVTKLGMSRKIGLIVPGVAYSEFFPPIVSRISRLAQNEGYVLFFGDISSPDPKLRAEQAEKFAKDLVRHGVSGVIYQPLEFLSDAERINENIVSIFDVAHVSVVLLDCDILMPPQRSIHDVVGINNFDAGFRLATHLLSVGARKINFLMRPNWALSVRNRCRGVLHALMTAKVPLSPDRIVLEADPEDVAALRRHLRKGRPDAFVCGNDTAAALFKKTLEKVGLRVPDDLLLAAFDDVRIAPLLTPPLTSVRQPVEEIATTAFRRLVDRMEHPELPTTELLLSAPLVVRASSLQKRKKGKKNG